MGKSGQVAYEVIDPLGRWCIWVISITPETVDNVHEIRAGVFHNMENFLICALDFPQ